MVCTWEALNEVEVAPFTVANTAHVQTPAGHPSIEDQFFEFTFLTGQKALDTVFINYELICTSTKSTNANRSARHVFRVDYKDECHETRITPAFNNDVTIPLFEFFYESMEAYSTQNLQC